MEPITQTLGYLLAQICKAHRYRINDRLHELDLHVGQEMILLRLWQGDGLTQRELADSMCVQPATIARMLARMERSGLVQRHTDAADHRVLRVCLTPAGRRLHPELRTIWMESEATLLANLTDEERAQLYHLLRRVAHNLSVNSVEPAAKEPNDDPLSPN